MNRHFRIACFIPSLLLFLSCATGKDLSHQLEKDLRKNENTHPWFRGVMVYDPASQKVVLEHNSSKYFTPASTTKLLTFYAGLKILKDSVPALNYGVSHDTLYFTGTGDPTFLHEDFDSSEILNFLRKTEKTLVLVPALISEKTLGPGWAWDDYNYSFSAERSAFPIYGNTVSFSFTPEDSLLITPPYFKGGIIEDTAGILRIERLQKKNRFKTPLFGTSAFKQDVPFITSPELAVSLLTDTLKRKVHLRQKLPKNIRLHKQVMSQPANSIFQKILQDSDNFLSEQLLLMAAGIITDTLNSRIAIDHVKEKYFSKIPGEIQWIDGSGLSRYNLLTPRSLVWVLERLYKEVPQERLFSLLPAGGVSGTLKDDYKSPADKPPFIYAKTGTMRNNHSLAGYLVTASGKVLIFSFMNSNFTVPTSVVKTEIDKILRQLHLNY